MHREASASADIYIYLYVFLKNGTYVCDPSGDRRAYISLSGKIIIIIIIIR